jgi:hypothetical protein
LELNILDVSVSEDTTNSATNITSLGGLKILQLGTAHSQPERLED